MRLEIGLDLRGYRCRGARRSAAALGGRARTRPARVLVAVDKMRSKATLAQRRRRRLAQAAPVANAKCVLVAFIQGEHLVRRDRRAAHAPHRQVARGTFCSNTSVTRHCQRRSFRLRCSCPQAPCSDRARALRRAAGTRAILRLKKCAPPSRRRRRTCRRSGTR